MEGDTGTNNVLTEKKMARCVNRSIELGREVLGCWASNKCAFSLSDIPKVTQILRFDQDRSIIIQANPDKPVTQGPP